MKVGVLSKFNHVNLQEIYLTSIGKDNIKIDLKEIDINMRTESG